MRWQHDWRGTGLINLRVLVYDFEYDKPQRQLGTLIIPPDPVPIVNARPEQYDIDEKTYRRTSDGNVRMTLDGLPRIESNLQSGSASS